MLVLKDNDYLEVSTNSLIADYDREIIANLYQPIIGFKAVSLYFSFITEASNQKINSIISHQSFFARTQMNASDFVDSRKYLEAVGLLKTFVSDLKGNKLYQYELYAPKTPKLFFDNTLLYGMLIKMVGEVEANKLKNLYLLNKRPEGKEITASFVEVFSPDFDDPAFSKAMELTGDASITRTSAKVISGFSYELFFKYLEECSQISPEAFSKKDMKEIERLATLYGITEEGAASTVAQLYNPTADKYHRIDFKELAKSFMEETNYRFLVSKPVEKVSGKVSGSGDLARKINFMETYSPKDYLTILQNGTIPASSDLKIINELSSKFKLPNCVINAIVDYVLTVNNNVLSQAFAEKIAGSLAREGVKTSIDAMNYLKKVYSKGKKRRTGKVEPVKEEQPVVNPVEEEEEQLDWEQMIKDLEEGDDDGEN